MKQRKQGRIVTGYMYLFERIKVLALLAAVCMILMLTACAKEDDMLLQAGSLIENGEYAKAIEILDAAEKSGADSRIVHRDRGIARMGLSDYNGAEKELINSLSANTGYITRMDVDTSYYLATAQYRLGDVRGANETYSAIISLYPDESDAFYFRGRTYIAMQDMDNAKSDFDKAIRLSPDDPDLYIQIYEALSEAGYAEEGQRYLKNAMELNTKLSYFQKGRLYYCMGEYEKAKGSLEHAVNEDKDFKATLYLGRTYEALGDMNYAVSLYRTYLESDPGNAEVLNQLGLCLMNLGEYASAAEVFQRGLETGDVPMEQSLYFNLITAYEHLGSFDKAKTLMADYLQKYPDDKEAIRENEFLATR
ncbi:MAG: tetratricopeptide repeat protein [Lachnospiraceae bacterium]|nr:tetratricopeptide repeat protein [Lachnospiraceae bacterium]